MTQGPITIAFGGDGAVSVDNVKALLNDWLGFGKEDADGYPSPSDREITLIFPITTEHLTPSLETILDWSAYADLPFIAVTNKDTSRAVTAILKDAEETIQAQNVNKKVIDLLKDAEGEVKLVLAWGDAGSDAAEVLLDLATDAGIQSLDLTAGLDPLVFDDDEPEEVTPDPEPEPVAKTARGSRRTKAATAELVPVEQEMTEADEKPVEKAKREAKEFGEKLAANKETARQNLVAKDGLQEEVAQAAHQAQSESSPLIHHAQMRLAHIENEAAILRQFLATQAGSPSMAPVVTAEPLSASSEDEPVRKGRGRPRKDGSAAQPRTEEPTSSYIKNQDGTFTKRGSGRIPRGLTTVQLTAAEVDELNEQGLIED